MIHTTTHTTLGDDPADMPQVYKRMAGEWLRAVAPDDFEGLTFYWSHDAQADEITYHASDEGHPGGDFQAYVLSCPWSDAATVQP